MSEHDHQAAFFTWASYQRFPGIELLHAIPNGGARHKAVAGKLKAEGVKTGGMADPPGPAHAVSAHHERGRHQLLHGPLVVVQSVSIERRREAQGLGLAAIGAHSPHHARGPRQAFS
jgi:hypothetical protein